METKNKRQICIMTQLCVLEIGQLVNSSKARYGTETVLSKSIGKRSNCVQETGQLVNSSESSIYAETVLSKSIGRQSKSSKF